MNQREKREIEALPKKYRPLGAWSYFWYGVLFCVPVVGFVFLIIFSLAGGNVARRSFARSFFCSFILLGIVAAASFLLSQIGGIGDFFRAVWERVVSFFTSGFGVAAAFFRSLFSRVAAFFS